MLRRFHALFIVALTLPFFSCALLKNSLSEYAPTISLKDVLLKGFDFEGADLEFKYTIQNRAAFGITFNKLAFQILVDGKRMVDAQNDKNVAIKAKETTEFSIIQRVRYVETATAFLDLVKKDSVTIALKGVVGVYINELVGSVSVPIEASKVVPVPKLPSIAFGSFDFGSMNMANPLNPSATFNLKFKINNANPFDIKVPKVEYAFTAAGTNVVSGKKQNQNLAKSSTAQLAIPVTLRGREIIDLVPKLRDLSSTDYKFDSAVEFNVMGQPLRVPFSYP
ncbi:MAG TPA: LEA type 2 family protein [Turneriella sp.]|nr:LEA type 2 family protein [Turneriella sp.]